MAYQRRQVFQLGISLHTLPTLLYGLPKSRKSASWRRSRASRETGGLRQQKHGSTRMGSAPQTSTITDCLVVQLGHRNIGWNGWRVLTQDTSDCWEHWGGGVAGILSLCGSNVPTSLYNFLLFFILPSVLPFFSVYYSIYFIPKTYIYIRSYQL